MPPTTADVVSCEVCGATEDLQRCARCKSAYYCSKRHQRTDWRRHRTFCRAYDRSYITVAPRGDAGRLPAAGSSEDEILSSRVEFLSPTSEHRAARREFPELVRLRDDPTDNNNTAEAVAESVCRNVIADMDAYGLCVLDGFLGERRGRAVLAEVLELYARGVFRDGELVSGAVGGDSRRIRGDRICWLDGRESGCESVRHLIGRVDGIVTRANRMPDNGKMGTYCISGRTKAMVACYPGSGTRYVTHVDNPNRDGRCITAIYYLNLNWDVKKSGGLLRIFPEGWTGDKVADIEPVFDRLLFFWSDRRNPHEVQPAFQTRYAITLWYFDAREREEARRRFEKEHSNVNVPKQHIESVT